MAHMIDMSYPQHSRQFGLVRHGDAVKSRAYRLLAGQESFLKMAA